MNTLIAHLERSLIMWAKSQDLQAGHTRHQQRVNTH